MVSPLLCKTTDRSCMISTNKHLIVPLHVPSLYAGLRAFLLETSAWSRKWEGRKRGGKVTGRWAKPVLFFLLLLLHKANVGTEIWQ